MTVIDQDRTKLDGDLKKMHLTLLLLSGSKQSKAGPIHDEAERVQETWQRTFWIQDIEKLTPKEKQDWFSDGGFYAVVGSREVSVDEWVRYVCKRGPHADLLTPPPASNPSAAFIMEAFASCSNAAARGGPP